MCKYCKGKAALVGDAFGNHVQIGWQKNGHMFIVNECNDGWYDYVKEFDIKYCPMCGKKLDKEL